MSSRAYSASESDASEAENVYCIFLHIVEGIGLKCKDNSGGDFSDRHRKDKIILNASLNGVKFEVEGHSTETSTIFNSNCIWECELGDIKRMKTDNRPVKLECFNKSTRSDHSPRKSIGTLLLPIRGIQTLTALRNVQLKLHWHKLGTVSPGWRQNKPEIYLVLIIVKKSLIDNGQFELFLGKKKPLPNDVFTPNISETALMLQSQSNVYVQLLEQLGLIQVGNNPDVDCDIFNVSLTFKQVKHLRTLLELEHNCNNGQKNVFAFHYDFLGSASQLDIIVNPNDSYTINEKISISFKSSLKSLRAYFTRIFYIPINLYLNGIAIANYRFDFSRYLPESSYFNSHKFYTKNGLFHFDRLHKILSPRAQKPSVDFLFSIQLMSSHAKRNNYEMIHLNETFVPFKVDEKTAVELSECYRNLDIAQSVQLHKCHPFESALLSHRNFNSFALYDKNYIKANPDALTLTQILEIDKHDLNAKSSEEFAKEASTEKEDTIKNLSSHRLLKPNNNPSNCVSADEKIHNADNLRKQSVGIDTRDIRENCDYVKTIGVNTEEQAPDIDEITLKIVQELEEWKAQQMNSFLNGLEHKETAYLADLDQQWEQQRAILQARLEAKIAKCEELNAKLEKAQAEVKVNAVQNKEILNVVECVKRDIERSYANKFQMLDNEMQRLRLEIKQKSCINEIENKNVQMENTKLERVKNELKERIELLEKQLESVEKSHFSAEQFKDVLGDLRTQTERFAEMEKSKDFYKGQWTKTVKEMHKLKLNILKKEEKTLMNPRGNNMDICLEEILSEEQDALKSDRSELKSIKDLLFDTSDTASISSTELNEV